MQKSVRSTSNILEYFKWKFTRFMLERKQNKIIKFYQAEKYDKIVKLFKTQKDYEELTLDSFPFLYFMISQNNVNAVKQFVEKYQFKDFMMINDSNPLKCTPIQYSILQNKPQISDVLQQNGANIHISNSEGQNAVHLSTIFNRKDAFDECIKRNIQINGVDIFGNTPFHYACRVGSVQMITTLVAAKAKKVANKLNEYPIHMAIESGKIQCVSLLQNDIMRPYSKFHPIHSAARCNNVNVFKYIYQKNPKFILEKDQHLSTALHHAVSIQDTQIVKFILQRLPKNPSQVLQAQDQYGNTPLHLAFLNSNIDILRQLTHRRANIKIQNNDQLTPIDYGLTSQHSDVKRFLMELQGWKQYSDKTL